MKHKMGRPRRPANRKMVGGKKMCRKKSQGATWAPKVLTEEELWRMVEATESQRDRAIMSVLHESGPKIELRESGWDG